MSTKEPVYSFESIVGIVSIVVLIAFAGYFVYQEITSRQDSSQNQEVSDLEIVMQDLNINFNSNLEGSTLHDLNEALQAIEDVESVEFAI